MKRSHIYYSSTLFEDNPDQPPSANVPNCVFCCCLGSRAALYSLGISGCEACVNRKAQKT